MRSPLYLGAVLTLLVGCFEPESDPTEEVSELQDGTWKLHLDNATAGPGCEHLELELGDTVVPAEVGTPGTAGLVIELEGLMLRGERGDGWLQASGRVDEDVSEPGKPEPGEDPEDVPDGESDDGDEDSDWDDSDDDAAPPPCEVEEDIEEEPRREDGLYVVVDADILARDHVEGELELELVSDAESCFVTADLVGFHVGPSDGPVVDVEETEDVPAEEVCG